MNLANLNIFFGITTILILSIGLFLIFNQIKTTINFNKNDLVKNRNYIFIVNNFWFKFSLLLLSFILVLFSVFRPQWGIKTSLSSSKGIDIVFSLDVSKSMKALDMNIDNSQTDRLDMAKKMIKTFVENNKQNRYSLVIFAGEAFVSTPLTLDHNVFLTFLEGVDYSDIRVQGTNLVEALKSSIARFQDTEKRGKAIVLISDGGDDVTGDFNSFASSVKNMGIKIFTIGIGSKSEVPIPEGQDFFGQIHYKQYQGETVLTKLNEAPLKEIANFSDGKYFHANKINDLDNILIELENLQTTVINKESKSLNDDKYQYFLLPAFLLFLLFAFLKDLPINNIIKFPSKKIFSLILGLIILNGCALNDLSFRYYNNLANNLGRKNMIKEAITNYQNAQKKSTKLAYIAQNNEGITNYAQSNFAESKQLLESAINNSCESKKNDYCDQLYYNLGNTYYKLGEKNSSTPDKIKQWEQAISTYEKNLKLDPNNKLTQENIDFIKNKLAELKKPEPEQSDQNKQEESEKKKDEENNKEKQNQTEQEKQKKEEQEQSDQKQQEELEKQKKEEQEQEKKQEESKSGDKSGEENKQGKSESGEKTDSLNNQPNNPNQLDKNLDQQIENYLKEMEENQANLQPYFKQNPNNEDSYQQNFDNFFQNDLFNDPFFQNFFPNPKFNNNPDNQNQTKDW